MAFTTIPCYAATCDRCGDQADYDEFCGFVTTEQAVEAAVDWIELDGALLCPGCRPCQECGTRGGHSDDHGFLCLGCRTQRCACGHQRRWHELGFAGYAPRCLGNERADDMQPVSASCPCEHFTPMGVAV
ncbi:hypothetical protein [Nocardia wallacei]|uniref:hypothetical protein n=1 Tax=Nocardia wallacei TaxID=480035 RepID=UPI0024556835|nr:hypothetical protein [Nocardia wallacei]